MLQEKQKQNYILFTDLDGTLLNHHDYSFAPALEMIDFLKRENIPLVIVTSKTKDEVILLQKDLKIKYPFIIENGAGIFTPKGEDYELIALGKKYDESLIKFNLYSKIIKMRGFHQMSDEEVAKLTGLSLEKAKLAKKRTFSEPFVFEDENDFKKLKELALKDGFDIVKGGRFYHLITKGQDKAKALNVVKKMYEKKENKTFLTIALGDSQNDITMLKNVNIAFLIPKYDNTYMENNIKNLIKAKYPGAKGWNEVLKEYFDVK